MNFLLLNILTQASYFFIILLFVKFKVINSLELTSFYFQII
jgi:hypothetical protein